MGAKKNEEKTKSITVYTKTGIKKKGKFSKCKKEDDDCEEVYDKNGEKKKGLYKLDKILKKKHSKKDPTISKKYKIKYFESKYNNQKGEGNWPGHINEYLLSEENEDVVEDEDVDVEEDEDEDEDVDVVEDEGIIKSKDGLKWTNKLSKVKYDLLLQKIGSPNKICKNSNRIVEYVIWQDPYDDVTEGKFGGLDYLKITNHHARKWHPKPADVFIIAGKYLEVPDHLLGPIKYASETINIEQLFVEKEGNINFGKTGIKPKALVTGSCASIDISTITVAFVEDMITLHKDNMQVDVALHQTFKEEYDKRIYQYIDDRTFKNIPWYQQSYFE